MKIEEVISSSKDGAAKIMLDAAKKILSESRVSVGDVDIPLPETFDVKLKYKEKRVHAKFKIEFLWDLAASEATAKMPTTALNSLRPAAASSKEFKSVKKLLEKKLLAIESNLKNGKPVSAIDMNRFLELIDASRRSAKRDRQAAMEELRVTGLQLIKAIETNDVRLATDKIAAIKELKAKYHQTFK